MLTVSKAQWGVQKGNQVILLEDGIVSAFNSLGGQKVLEILGSNRLQQAAELCKGFLRPGR